MDTAAPRLVYLRSDLAETPIPVVGPPVPYLLIAQSAALPPEPTVDGAAGGEFDHIAAVATDRDTYRFSHRVLTATPVTCANGHGPDHVLYGPTAPGPWFCADCLVLGIGAAAD